MSFQTRASEDETRILVFLHERVAGFGPGYAITIGECCEACELTFDKFARAATYLAGHGLIGFRPGAVHGFMHSPIGLNDAQALATQDAQVRLMSFNRLGVGDRLWMSSLGEALVRDVEAQPNIGRRLTMGALKSLGVIVQSTVTHVLTEMVKAGIHGTAVPHA